MSMRLYRSLQEHLWDRVPVGLFRLTAEMNGRFVSASPYVCQFLGYAGFSELAECDMGEIVMDEAVRTSLFETLLATGGLQHREVEVRRKDGTRVWISITAQLLRDAVGAPLYVDGVFFDVTAHQHIVSDLRRCRAMIEAMARFSSWGLYLCDPEGRAIYSNDTCRQIFGFVAEEGDPDQWLAAVHPEDRTRVADAVARCVRTKSDCDLTYRLVSDPAKPRLIRDRAAPFLDERGVLAGFVGTLEIAGEPGPAPV